MPDRCDNCRFFLAKPDDVSQGWCRAHPPNVDGILPGHFTVVLIDWWCGEYDHGRSSDEEQTAYAADA
jgi:hypothetical protein